jgi:hypothetical protein
MDTEDEQWRTPRPIRFAQVLGDTIMEGGDRDSSLEHITWTV